MSYWSQITACIVIDTMKETKDIKAYVENILKDAPQITGSEGSADIFVNPLGGHNVSSGRDCENCKYKDTYGTDGKYEWCDGFNPNHMCEFVEYQTQVAITIVGNLRDRYYEITKQEYNEFLKFIKKQKVGKVRWEIETKACRINGAKWEIAADSITHY